jgi:hypothetical protein
VIDTCAHKHRHDGDVGIGCDDDPDEKIAVSFYLSLAIPKQQRVCNIRLVLLV